ncbi:MULTISPECIES: hypothetical protein [unclassified Mesorhizobium]|uniref:hypothetical protein n=1 Tax=unclassified Mesorhizobium TaxID=325217 RepID=UPI000FDA693F|nr:MULTISPECIES: hypothetical protein [unclassified Mesorhizobium]TGR39964.1 hypothetical protein EN842_38955 [bacterium M00.F.Ca.ET.199.01.1.1]TGU24169.1 hypothetical protein EN799_48245 [bacterium M00.F.Ca.ET.156.01.1.1]TGV89384.1 hypothetical protein EN792_004215 [Mesorhizobium sp. M00.F.Ca.ET.149.01.1.1]TGR23341.1 hypothetical protein EN845_20275 [Mesorhizobium sp. M8A.F.Ca.ET.202.01.1.1]TGR24574.1 hypothetical protein EN840_18920 [Mesorhizobium sp. M8A.F.Ca.ET.197.01.1.1]
MNKRIAICSGSAVALLGVGAFVLPKGWQATHAFFSEEASVQYQIDHIPANDYLAGVNDALNKKDTELAQSIVALASDQGIQMPPDVNGRIKEAEENTPSVWEDIWEGTTTGEADTTAGSIAAGITDLLVIGDIRDLHEQYQLYPKYDPLTVALAAGGIAITGATVATAGGALPARAGVTLLKSARKAGGLNTELVVVLEKTVAKTIDKDALQTVAKNAFPPNLKVIREAAPKIVSSESITMLKSMGSAVYTIGKDHGKKAAMQTLSVAESAADLDRWARIAKSAPKKTFRAMVRLAPTAGKGLLHLGTLGIEASAWTATLVLWLLSTLYFGFKVLRFGFRMLLTTGRCGIRTVKP